MLSLVSALVATPKALIADEPTLGLAALLGDVMDAIPEIRALGTAVLLVEEHVRNALKTADTVALMDLGRIVWSGSRTEADMDMDMLSQVYFGDRIGPTATPARERC
jgi:branched-chain amino acid transport system ATP-binding protein